MLLTPLPMSCVLCWLVKVVCVALDPSKPKILDVSKPKAIHIIGIGGAGMSAIAHVLLRMGHSVSGSDATEGVPVARLRDEGATITIGHHGDNLPDHLDALAYSTAVPKTNPE